MDGATVSSALGIRKIFVEQHSVLATTGLTLVALGTIYIAKVGGASSSINGGTEAFRELCRAVGFSKSSVYGYSNRSRTVLDAMIRRFGSPRASERSVVWSNALDRPDEEMAESIEFVSSVIQELFGVRTMMEMDAKLSNRGAQRSSPDISKSSGLPITSDETNESLRAFKAELGRLEAFDPAVEVTALITLRSMIDRRISELSQ